MTLTMFSWETLALACLLNPNNLDNLQKSMVPLKSIGIFLNGKEIVQQISPYFNYKTQIKLYDSVNYSKEAIGFLTCTSRPHQLTLES